MRLLIYEHVCAGGLGASPPESLRAEGFAMLDALVADFAATPGVSVTTLLAPAFADLPRSRCLRDTSFDAALTEVDAALVVAPEFDGILARLSETVAASGVRSLGCAPDAIRLTSDKLALADVWRRANVATPATVADDAPPPFPPPWVVKPRDGAGSLAIRCVNRADALAAALAEARAEAPTSLFCVQEFATGTPASVGLLVGPRQTLALAPGEQRLSDDGRFRYRGGRLPLGPALAERARRVALAAVACVPGLAGYVGVDLVLGATPADDRAIEINPRVTTSYVGLRRLTRANLATLWHAMLHEIAVAEPTWSPAPLTFRVD